MQVEIIVKNLFQSVNSSLKRLNTEYIDLLWVHVWDYMTPIEEVMRSLDDLIWSGKVLYIGISYALHELYPVLTHFPNKDDGPLL
jgi:aryl-alcohol dehydrogenase-like predicted oxidoreductase